MPDLNDELNTVGGLVAPDIGVQGSKKFDAAVIEPATITLISDYQGNEDNELEESRQQNISDNIGNWLVTLFGGWRDNRRNEQEDILLDCERAWKNKYDLVSQTELAQRQQESGDSTVWVPITRTKVNIAVAKTYEKMLNSSDMPWSITPLEVTAEQQKQAQQDVAIAVQANALAPDISPEQALAKMEDYLAEQYKEKAENMEKEIADQLNKADAMKEISKVILQQHYLGTGALKFEATVFEDEHWVQDPQTRQWSLQMQQTPFPKGKFVSLFNLFFDPYATDVGSSLGVIERHVLTRSQLLKYKNMDGFKAEKIDEIIRYNPSGNHIDLDYETTLRALNEQDQNVTSAAGYYDVLEGWVDIDGDKLITYGMGSEGIEPHESYKVNVWVCAGITFKIILNPFEPARHPYFIVPYEHSPHTIYGTGVAENLFGVQDVINSVTRAAIDNAAFSNAPMCEINVDMLKSGEAPPQVVKPRHLFLREGGDPKEPMVRFYQPTENSVVLYQLMELFNKIGEDVTGVAGSTEESMPAANLANAGVSMSLTQKNILQRTVIANLDQYLFKPLIKMMYDFNMKWSEKEDIKVPAKVTANGVTSIIAKEMRSQQLLMFAQLTGTPEDRNIVDRKELLGELATALDQDEEKLLYSDEQQAENNKAQAEAAMQAAKAEQESIVGQIDAENRGELQQEALKAEAAIRKQEMVNRAKLMEIAAKQKMELTKEELKFIQSIQQQYGPNNQGGGK